ncbi:Na+/H+ antiporter NhaC family protein [Bernardetia sp.]|uniref:Na+/H+ antiporter NhaC family protein n=1 Tax=Bernardetia sp. TaxID=1937974 RepID=UPI0025C5D0FF|nr:Na+/H+ antiporter NhaC family protein [Bernardetia sp.]
MKKVNIKTLPTPKANGVALFPLIIFVGIFLGAGIYFQDFYALPSPIAVCIGILAAFILIKIPFKENIDIFLKGCGEEKILTMCIIYLLAGAFSAVTKATGSVDAVVSLGINYISPSYYPAGIFLVAAFLSLSAGTSVGAIVALGSVVVALSEQSGISLSLLSAALLTGAMFGDNLSIISDTTIVATQSLGCEMKDKMRTNAKIALPAALITVAILIVHGFSFEVSSPNSIASSEISWLLIVPYVFVIVASLAGLNVFVVLFLGVVLSGMIGLYGNHFDIIGFSKTAYAGFEGMSEIFYLSLLTGGLAAMVEKGGGIQFVLEKISHSIKSQHTALIGIATLVSTINLCIANNTVSILISGKIAKTISDNYSIRPQVTASLLDIFACIVQGLLPYGAQVLLLMSLSKGKINYFELLSQSWYLHILAIFSLGLLFQNRKAN